jgi:hypothetical protein
MRKLFFIFFLSGSVLFSADTISWIGVEVEDAPENRRQTVFGIPYGKDDPVDLSTLAIDDSGKVVKKSDLFDPSLLDPVNLEDQFDFETLSGLEAPVVYSGPTNGSVTDVEVAASNVPVQVEPVISSFEKMEHPFSMVFLSKGFLILNGHIVSIGDELLHSVEEFMLIADYGEEFQLIVDSKDKGLAGMLGQEIVLDVNETILSLYPGMNLSLENKISFIVPEGAIDLVMKYQGFNNEQTSYSFNVLRKDAQSLEDSLGEVSFDLPDRLSLKKPESPILSPVNAVRKSPGIEGGERIEF